MNSTSLYIHVLFSLDFCNFSNINNTDKENDKMGFGITWPCA